jgi:integrase
VRVFLEVVADDPLYAMWATAFATGMRRGELLAVMWSEVDLEARRIGVVRQVVNRRGGPRIEQGTKSGPGRVVSIDDRTAAALRARRKAQLAERLAFGPAYADHDLAFAQPDGRLIRPRWASDTFLRLGREAGLPRLTLHGTRHTYCTLALRAGVHPKIVSDQAGHASVAVTLDIYSHAVPGMAGEAAEVIGDLIHGR